MFYIKTRDKPELKHHDFSFTANTPIPSTGLKINSIVDISQSALFERRIGFKVTIKKITINILFEFTTSVDTVPSPFNNTEVIDVSVILDKQANGQAPVLTGGGGDGAFTGLNPMSLPNPGTENRYTFLSHAVILFNSDVRPYSDVTGSGNPPSIPITIGTTQEFFTSSQLKYWSFDQECDIDIMYSGIGAGMANIKSNNICLMFRALYGTNILVKNGFGRCWFEDM